MNSKKTLIPFIEAKGWNQDIALARSELIDKADEYISVHSPEIGITKALNKFLKAYNKGRVCNEIRQILKNKRVRKSTYYAWVDRYKSSGLSGLLNGYNNGGCRIAPEVIGEIKRLIWENHLTLYQDILDDLQVVFSKEKLPSYSAIRRYAKSYRDKNWPALVLKHEGQKGLRDRNMLPVLGRMDEDLTSPNQKWEIDTTIADLFTGRKIKDVTIISKDGKRCKIIGIIDVYSRMVKYVFCEKETALMVGTVLRDRFLTWGIPCELVIDNGRPYKNNRVLQFLKNIGVSVHICIPGNPVEKPHIERAFGTLSRKLFRRALGYSGNCVQTRPNEIQIQYTMAEAQMMTDDWVDSVYAEKAHRSTGQRPRERMNPPDFTPKTIHERELDIFLMETHSRKVRQGHITYLDGKYFHSLLPEGQDVVIKPNDFDASEILVFIGGKYLCTAIEPKKKGKKPSEILEMKKERNRELRTRVKAHEALIHKDMPKDQRIHDLIEHHKKINPIELPKKCEVVKFPGLAKASFSNPDADLMSEPKDQSLETSGERKGKLIRNKQEKYLDCKKRIKAGESLDDIDNQFLNDYQNSNEYRLIKKVLERNLAAGGGI
jgi:Integrase core domain/Mu transposase, C-terminal